MRRKVFVLKSKLTRLSRIKKHKYKVIALLFISLLWWFSLPSTLFKNPSSTVVTSRQGNLLGARIAADGQWRFPEIEELPFRFEKSLLLYEDEYFYKHPGINPVSTAKALWSTLITKKRRGGSTLTQQVIRLSRKNPKRTYVEKFIESVQASRLEVKYKKKKILKLYASHAPFGSNVVGLSAASWRYFGIEPEDLSWGQAATLAVLPNAPSLIYPGKNEEILLNKRNRLLKKLFEKEIIDQWTYELALEEPLPGKPLPLPDIAPHFTEKIRKKHPQLRFQSTLDFQLQRKVNSLVAGYHAIYRQNQIHNIAVLVLDVETREVLAYVGNSPTTPDHHSFVDIITKARSTGSVLKPFLYAAALDAGEILPQTLIADYPLRIDGYTPENYDKNYRGMVSAGSALTQSLNIPFVRLLKDYDLNRFLSKFKKTNQHYIDKNSDYYGLAFILGGAESSLWDVTKAYAGLASTLNSYTSTSSAYFAEEFTEPVYGKKEAVDKEKTQLTPLLYGAGSIYQTFQALRNLNRPSRDANWEVFESTQPIAWKTGTSFGFKDAWAVGTTARYAIGVWVGNADGEGRPGILGVEAAAPILFDVLAELPKTDWFAMPYDDLEKVKVCSLSGHLAGDFCEHTREEWIPLKSKQTSICPYHRRVFLDENEQYQVNSSCYSLDQMLVKNWFDLPPIAEYYYRNHHPEYNPLPPFRKGCLRPGENIMGFIFPKPNQSVLLPKNFDEEINEVIFKLAHRGDETKVYWYLDEQFLGVTEDFHEISYRPTPGRYLLTAVDQQGNEIKEWITIKNP